MQETDIVTLYGILIDRNKHEGTLFWTRYAAFFAIVSGLGVAWSKGLSANSNNFWADPFVQGVIVTAGAVAAFLWSLVAFDGARWQEYFNRRIQELESQYSYLPQLYTNIYQPRFLPDVVALATVVAAISFVAWVIGETEGSEKQKGQVSTFDICVES